MNDEITKAMVVCLLFVVIILGAGVAVGHYWGKQFPQRQLDILLDSRRKNSKLYNEKLKAKDAEIADTLKQNKEKIQEQKKEIERLEKLVLQVNETPVELLIAHGDGYNEGANGRPYVRNEKWAAWAKDSQLSERFIQLLHYHKQGYEEGKKQWQKNSQPNKK